MEKMIITNTWALSQRKMGITQFADGKEEKVVFLFLYRTHPRTNGDCPDTKKELLSW